MQDDLPVLAAMFSGVMGVRGGMDACLRLNGKRMSVAHEWLGSYLVADDSVRGAEALLALMDDKPRVKAALVIYLAMALSIEREARAREGVDISYELFRPRRSA